ncbi:NAD(P)-dependent dehydrogenase (short-subunit alcohol dehydrogenase family) [Kribbella aluminosa]|uniref:NAD(P)-dependent dehydrogenase (Short-subunit alcohol dehydrogenase family) n=1 Tax=Kribbella aluminosa TaxID=416017 RepID=A0ABS4UNN4_9ACTN|nr:SDR family NAD(P)-dependent oxidoreductase [Kribbella aluminosa]MBP2353241.1 NAD(P)-dependent dehydrogenase (short-subunit alcohol dehydrogenase family) [Kribbella aluminosa]
MTRQQLIGTGFTAASTADDVLAGIDLTGKNAIVTGGHRGLGLAATQALRKAGAHVTVAVRNPAAFEAIDGVEASQLDLLDPRSIDAFAERYLANGWPLHIVINNAGIMAGPLYRDARGYESQFATNHLGHFQLTLGLLPALQAAHGARIVNVTSGGHRLSDIRWDDPQFTDDYDPLRAYGQSKTANVLFAVELERRWSQYGIHAFAAHPGIVITTNLGPHLEAGETRTPWLSLEDYQAMGLVDADGNQIIDPARERKTVAQGASTAVFGATSPLLEGHGGTYLKDNDISPLDLVGKTDFHDPDVRSYVVPHAVDPESAVRLWNLSEDLVKH